MMFFVLSLVVLLVFSIGIVSGVYGDVPNLEGKILELNEQLILKSQELKPTNIIIQFFSRFFRTVSGKDTIGQEMINIAKERKDKMLQLLEEDPGLFLESTLSKKQRDEMPREVKGYLEKGVVKRGKLEVIHIDDFENKKSEEIYYIYDFDKKERFRIYSVQKLLLLISGTSVKISGIQLDNNVVLFAGGRGFEVGAAAPSFVEDNLGEQETIAVLVNSYDNPIEPITAEETYRRFFDDGYDRDGDGFADSLNAYVKEVSYGKAFLTGDVFGWYTLPNEIDVCNVQHVLNYVIDLVDPEINFLDYSRLVIVIPQSNCGFVGVGTIGSMEVNTQDGLATISLSFLNGVNKIDSKTGAHELGHNFGVMHANDWECGDEVIRDNCESINYGDAFDLMGISVPIKGHYNLPHKETIGWLDSSNVLVTNSPGRYIIDPIEIPSNGIQGLKIQTQDQFNYYVEYRRSIGLDTINSNMDIYNGAVVHIDLNVLLGDTQLLDMTPHIVREDLSQSEDSIDTVLRVGETFYDPENDVMITTIDVTDEYLEIYLGSINCGDGVIDTGEDCDGQNLNVNTCEILGFRSGDLSCGSDCRFDTSLCIDPICPSEHVSAGGNSCIAIIKSDPADGFISNGIPKDQLSDSSWNDIRHSSISRVNGNRAFISLYAESNHPIFGSGLSRVSLPFDTSSIPEGSRIDFARIVLINLNPGFAANSHPESNDFITLVATTLENSPFLSSEDFDQFSSVDNPIELGERIDVSDFVESGGLEVIFELNEQGLENINTEGYSGFGLRTGYDLFDQTPNNGEYTYLSIYINSLESNLFPSILTVNYRNPLLRSDFDDDGDVDLDDFEIFKSCFLIIPVTECGELNEPNAIYQLTQDISTRKNENCLSITADGIILDGAGYSIIGDETHSGIFALGRSDLLIKDLTINNFYSGIRFRTTDNSMITNVDVSSNSRGIYLLESNNNRLTQITAKDNRLGGITIDSGSTNIIEESIACGNRVDFRCSNSPSNTFINNFCSDPDTSGCEGLECNDCASAPHDNGDIPVCEKADLDSDGDVDLDDYNFFRSEITDPGFVLPELNCVGDVDCAGDATCELDASVNNIGGRCSGREDFDNDGDVDLDDYSIFETCFSGPVGRGFDASICEQTDLDGDGRMTLADYNLFRNALTVGSLPELECQVDSGCVGGLETICDRSNIIVSKIGGVCRMPFGVCGCSVENGPYCVQGVECVLKAVGRGGGSLRCCAVQDDEISPSVSPSASPSPSPGVTGLSILGNVIKQFKDIFGV